MRLFATIAAVCLALVLIGPQPAGGIEPSDGRGLAPYRYNPSPDSLTPAQEGVARAYEFRLRSKLRRLELQEFDADPLEQEQLRDTRRELNRIEQMLRRR